MVSGMDYRMYMYRRGRVRKGKYYWERPGGASGREGGSKVNWLETGRFKWKYCSALLIPLRTCTHKLWSTKLDNKPARMGPPGPGIAAVLIRSNTLIPKG